MSTSVNNKSEDRSEVAEPFPTDVLPAPLATYVEEYAEAMGVPPDMIAVPLLSALGASFGTTRVIEVKPGWRELPLLWTCVVAPPGSAKSPSLQAALRGIHRRQAELAEKFKEAMGRYEDSSNSTKKDTTEKRRKPKLRQVSVSDTTAEALADVLHDNPRGILSCQDELAAWVLSFNQYKSGGGSDRQTWSSFWNSAPVTINRRSRPEPLHIEQPFVSVTGGIQPDVLGELHDERGREDGFIHRILFAYPHVELQPWTDVTPCGETIASFDEVFQELVALKQRLTHRGSVPSLCTSPTKAGHYSSSSTTPSSLK